MKNFLIFIYTSLFTLLFLYGILLFVLLSKFEKHDELSLMLHLERDTYAKVEDFADYFNARILDLEDLYWTHVVPTRKYGSNKPKNPESS